MPRILFAAVWLPLVAAPLGAQVAARLDLTASAALPDAPSSSVQQTTPQQTAPPQTAPAAPAAPPQNETDVQRQARERREEAAREVKAEEKQRIGGVVPDFNVVLNGQAVPLSPRQKFDIAFHSAIDPYNIALAVVAGGFGELTDDHTGYGHGPSGYFKRFGAAYADNVSGTFFGNALLPSLLHQDPRYYRKGTGTIKSRILYSALTTIICHGDNGKLQFNVSNVLGNFIAGGLSNAYYPADERGAGLTISNAAVVTLEGSLGAQILEFSPDVTAYLSRRRQAKRERKAAAAGLPPPAAPVAAPVPVPGAPAASPAKPTETPATPDSPIPK